MSSAPLLPARFDWPSTVGDFLLKFGTLDCLIFVFLKDNLESAEYEKLKVKPFKKRVDRVAEHLRANGKSTKEQQEFSSQLTRLTSIQALRNHIAHAHMLIRLDPKSNTFVQSVSLPKDLDQEYERGTRHVTFEELRNSLNELTTLVEAFKTIVGFTT